MLLHLVAVLYFHHIWQLYGFISIWEATNKKKYRRYLNRVDYTIVCIITIVEYWIQLHAILKNLLDVPARQKVPHYLPHDLMQRCLVHSCILEGRARKTPTPGCLWKPTRYFLSGEKSAVESGQVQCTWLQVQGPLACSKITLMHLSISIHPACLSVPKHLALINHGGTDNYFMAIA